MSNQIPASSNPLAPSTPPAVVANRFVVKYYTMLNERPQTLFHFYKDNSTMTHMHEDSTTEEIVTGKENINKKIQSLNYQDCTVKITALDAQVSEGGGVLISVIGEMSNKGEPGRRFVHTFFLAVQTDPVGFYIRNDIFRYLKDAANVQTPVAEQPAVHHVAPVVEVKEEHIAPVIATPNPTPVEPEVPIHVAPVVETPKVEHVAPKETIAPAPVVTEQPKEVPVPKEQPKEKKEEEKKPEHPAQHTSTTTSHRQQEPKPPKQKKPQPQPQQQQVAHPVPEEKKANQSPTWATVLASPGSSHPTPQVLLQLQTQQKEEEKKQQEDKKKEKKVGQDNPECTVIVTNLPYSVLEDKVRTTFLQFGDIKGINLRNGFAFIEFASAEIANKAVAQTQQIQLDGRTISIDPRKKKFGSKENGNFKDYKKQPNNNGTPTSSRSSNNKPQQYQNDLPPKSKDNSTKAPTH